MTQSLKISIKPILVEGVHKRINNSSPGYYMESLLSVTDHATPSPSDLGLSGIGGGRAGGGGARCQIRVLGFGGDSDKGDEFFIYRGGQGRQLGPGGVARWRERRSGHGW
jgi:hypothetical protein